VRQHLEQLAGAAVALRHAGGVDQHHLLGRQQLQQVFERGPVVRGVNRHAEDAAIGAQLFVRADAVGVEGDQAQVAGAMLGGESGRDLGSAGGLADAGGADQREHAALVFQRGFGFAGQQVAFEHVGGPGVFVANVGGHALDQLAGERRREAAVQQLLNQLRLHRLALQFFHEGQCTEAVFDQALHRAQLVHHVLLVAAGDGLVHGAGRVGQGRHGGHAHFFAQHRRLTQQRRAGGGSGSRYRGSRRRHDRQRWRFWRCGVGLACSQALLERAGQVAFGFDERGFLLTLMGADRGLAALQHAFTHVVLERQRAHRQACDVFTDVFFGGGAARWSSDGWLGGGRLGGRSALLKACGCAGTLGGGTACSGVAGHRRSRQPLDLLHAFRRHRQNFHAFGAGLGGQHHGVFAKSLANQGQGVARGARGKSFDVHRVLQQNKPLRRACNCVKCERRVPGTVGQSTTGNPFIWDISCRRGGARGEGWGWVEGMATVHGLAW